MNAADVPTLKVYCRESLEILETAVDLYRQGKLPFYRIAALQLRLLLCDTTRRHGRSVDVSLIPQVFPGVTLPVLDPRGAALVDAPELPLETWLAQPIKTEDVRSLSIRLLIRRVCEQDGGAHVDPKPVAGLSGFSNYQDWIISISDIVLHKIKPMFS